MNASVGAMLCDVPEFVCIELLTQDDVGDGKCNGHV